MDCLVLDTSLVNNHLEVFQHVIFGRLLHTRGMLALYVKYISSCSATRTFSLRKTSSAHKLVSDLYCIILMIQQLKTTALLH